MVALKFRNNLSILNKKVWFFQDIFCWKMYKICCFQNPNLNLFLCRWYILKKSILEWKLDFFFFFFATDSSIPLSHAHLTFFSANYLWPHTVPRWEKSSLSLTLYRPGCFWDPKANLCVHVIMCSFQNWCLENLPTA